MTDFPVTKIYQQQASLIPHTSNILTAAQALNEYNGMYETINTLSPLLSLHETDQVGIRAALSTMTSFTRSFYEQTQFISNISQTLQPILDSYTIRYSPT